MPTYFHYLPETVLLIVLGALIAYPLILLNIRFAPALGLIDWPKARGLTDHQIPIVGASLVVFSMIAFAIINAVWGLSSWFLISCVIMAIMGYFDDRRGVGAFDKMFFQTVCVAVVVLLDPQLHEAVTVRYGAAGMVWAVFFILGLVNAVNFIDGIDGLAAVVIIMGAGGLWLLARPFPMAYPFVLYSALLVGMMLPFFYLNVRHRKGFLGNMGSYFFSYVLAVMHLSLPIQSAGPVSRLSVAGLCFLIPIADACMVLITRLLTRRSPFHADKGHLHHRMIQTSIALRYILLTFGAIELAGVAVAFCLAENSGVRASMLPIFVCMSHVLIVATLILLVEKTSRKRMQAYFQRLETGNRIYFLKYVFTKTDGSAVSVQTLRRLEARISAEIRITDLCFLERPNTLHVTLKTAAEPLRGISARLDSIFQQEKVQAGLELEEGEFVRVARGSQTPRKSA